MACILVVGFAFAGSPQKLPAGVSIAGVDVGGMAPAEATTLLRRRAGRLANVPVVFTSGSRSWKVRPSRVGITVNWAAAVEQARREGAGFPAFRGLQRLRLRLFGDEVEPHAHAWKPAVAYRLDAFARAIDRPHRDAAVKLRGLRVLVVRGRGGRVLDRKAASHTLVGALASLERHPVPLPMRTDDETVTAADLVAAAEQARIAVSAPVRLRLGPTRWRIPRWRMAKLLGLPRGGATELRIGGPGANAFFRRLTRRIDRPPRNADWAILESGRVRVVPARDGLVVDVQKTAARLLTAATSMTGRSANVVVVSKPPARSTREARAMGITGLVGAYETIYGGDPNRIHNVRLVADLIDHTLIAPGKEFSFNATTGERTPEKGFRSAPVIINGELQTGIGGGVCQVSTTVFNAAYEAGVEINARTNHGLYISHYPLGRDATVNYPDIDLRFVNDTPRWLLLRTFVGESSLTVALYGRPTGRRVETETEPLVEIGPVPVERMADPVLYDGEEVVDETGQPPRATSVHRQVFDARGKLIHDDVWSSSYSGEPKEIRYGTKAKPAPPPPPSATKPEDKSPTQPPPAPTTTGTTTTTQQPRSPQKPAIAPRR